MGGTRRIFEREVKLLKFDIYKYVYWIIDSGRIRNIYVCVFFRIDYIYLLDIDSSIYVHVYEIVFNKDIFPDEAI